MASYTIEWKSSAVKELRKLPKERTRRILAAKENLFHTAQRNSWAAGLRTEFAKTFTGHLFRLSGSARH